MEMEYFYFSVSYGLEYAHFLYTQKYFHPLILLSPPSHFYSSLLVPTLAVLDATG